MNIRPIIRLSLISILLISMLLWHIFSICYEKQFEKTAFGILSDASSWQMVLSSAGEVQSVSEKRVNELLSENVTSVHSIEYLAEYSGIFLITKNRCPTKEGILISSLSIDPIPLTGNTGTEIELLSSSNGLYLYRLHYYWD